MEVEANSIASNLKMRLLILVGLVAVCFGNPLPQRNPCGVPAIAPNITSNIVGGTDAIPYSWPWQGVLLKKGSFTCGSTVISNNWLMTAGHCVNTNLDPKTYSVKLGVFDQRKDDEPGEVVSKFSEVHLHPKFYMHPPSGGLDNLTYDVALLKFASPINFTDHISPVCLPAKLDEPVPADGTPLWEIGWGRVSEHGSVSNTLKQTVVPIYNFEKCKEISAKSGFSIYPTVHFCQGYEEGKKEACSGDSGGPSMLQDPVTGAWTQLGITSASAGCARPSLPAVKSKVSAYIDFIEQYVTDL